MKYLAIIFLSALLLFTSCDNKTDKDVADNNTIVEFKGRKIDLAPYFEGFPYSGFTFSYKSGDLYYYEEGETRQLKSLKFDSNIDLKNGKVISNIDFSKRNVWGIRFNKSDSLLYWSGDEINDEVMNLYRLNPNTKAVEKLTDVPYMFGWGWNKDNKTIGYIARLGTKEDRLGEFRLLDLNTMEEETIIQDMPEMRYTWGSVVFSPDSKYAILPALKNAHRNFGNLMLIDIENKTQKLLTDSSVFRRGVGVYPEWMNDDEFLYTSNEDGFTNIYKYNLSDYKSNQITKFERDLSSYEVLEIDGEKFIFAVLANPVENEMFLVNPNTGEILYRETTDLNIGILDSKDNKVIASVNSNTVKFKLLEITVNKDSFEQKTILDIPQDLKDKILHAEVERVEYPTFDIDEKTGEARKIHAFLYKPENPLPKDEQMVIIQSFYGGSNIFLSRTQIMAEAGIYILSPAPRGSSGFGKDFYAMNDKDLGGNEIIDVIYAAKYISEKLDIPPSRIGVFGGSHGGYATMRLLSFPGEINGNKADFDFGFGMSHAGFSDIIHFYETCNIPDWVILEAGDPETEADKLRSRSPLYNAKDFTGKLLLTHGTNDSRVPIEGSRWMADSLKKYGKDFKLVEFEGQGHGIKGLENQLIFYKTWFDFLEDIK
jgi:dipeptidyl aminopeptidase/acylaminoacyl peptidase